MEVVTVSVQAVGWLLLMTSLGGGLGTSIFAVWLFLRFEREKNLMRKALDDVRYDHERKLAVHGARYDELEKRYIGLLEDLRRQGVLSQAQVEKAKPTTAPLTQTIIVGGESAAIGRDVTGRDRLTSGGE